MCHPISKATLLWQMIFIHQTLDNSNSCSDASCYSRFSSGKCTDEWVSAQGGNTRWRSNCFCTIFFMNWQKNFLKIMLMKFLNDIEELGLRAIHGQQTQRRVKKQSKGVVTDRKRWSSVESLRSKCEHD